MRAFDRIILATLALGVWALVLAPQEIGAHHQNNDGHSCDISGSAWGGVVQPGELAHMEIFEWGGVTVDCSHY